MPLGSKNATPAKPANRRFGPAHQPDAARALGPRAQLLQIWVLRNFRNNHALNFEAMLSPQNCPASGELAAPDAGRDGDQSQTCHSVTGNASTGPDHRLG